MNATNMGDGNDTRSNRAFLFASPGASCQSKPELLYANQPLVMVVVASKRYGRSHPHWQPCLIPTPDEGLKHVHAGTVSSCCRDRLATRPGQLPLPSWRAPATRTWMNESKDGC